MSFPRLAALSGVCCLFLPLLASAQNSEPFTNWPLPPPAPAGTNPAAYPMPRNDWMAHFARNVDHARAESGAELIFDGDSITDGWQYTGKAVWAKNYEKFKAIDFGIAGDHTEQVLWRVDHGQVEKLHPKLIVLLIGTNNIVLNSEAQIVEAIGAIVKDYQKHCPDAVILLQGIFPRAEKPTDPFRAHIKNINLAIAKFADGKTVMFQDFGDKFLEADGTISREMMPDFLHPTAKGYEIWAAAIRPTVERALDSAKQGDFPTARDSSGQPQTAVQIE